MCRFVAYRGPSITLDELLYKPEHSIIHQSVHSHERREPLNGDGWGVGWYQDDVTPEPALYRTVQPAWSDDNMRHVAPAVRTRLFLSHVRAASPGLAVQQLNCHPFMGGEHAHREPHAFTPVERGRRRLLFMHNGKVGAYRRVMRRLRRELPDDLYFSIRGTTDSEHAFAVIQQRLGDRVVDPTADDLADGVAEGLAYLEHLKHDVGGGDEETMFNVALTDGESLVVTRYADPAGADAQSLYVGRAREFYCEGDTCSARGPAEAGAVMVASERLFDDDRVWQKVPRNHQVIVDRRGDVTMRELEIDT